MREITRKVYKFEELTLEVRQAVVEKLEQQDMESGFLADDFNEYMDAQLNMHYPDSELKVQYSLGYSQGDGLNVYGQLAFSDVFTNIDGYTPKEQARLLHYLEYAVSSILIPQNLSHYAYCIARNIDITDMVERELNHYRNLDIELLERFEQDLKAHFTDLCNSFERIGYQMLYPDYTLDDVQDLCDSNDYEFYENGELYQ